jgi:hypothetical protein
MFGSRHCARRATGNGLYPELHWPVAQTGNVHIIATATSLGSTGGLRNARRIRNRLSVGRPLKAVHTGRRRGQCAWLATGNRNEVHLPTIYKTESAAVR